MAAIASDNPGDNAGLAQKGLQRLDDSALRNTQPAVVERSDSSIRRLNSPGTGVNKIGPGLAAEVGPVLTGRPSEGRDSRQSVESFSTSDSTDAASITQADRAFLRDTRTTDESEIRVYVYVTSVNDATLALLASSGLTIELSSDVLGVIQGMVARSDVASLTALSSVEKVTLPEYATPRAGSRTTEGDALLGGEALRELGVSGLGVKVGIISDGANDWTVARDSGDLPASGITVYGSCAKRDPDSATCDPGARCNEGTAMAEIIHDIAPDAEIAVGSAATTLEFIQRIDDLVNDFGADIIVDDLGFRCEPFFEDGAVALAVDAVTDQVVFVSAAGNSADNHHERPFLDLSTLNPAAPDSRHVFGFDSQGPDWRFPIYAEPGGIGAVFLQWREAFGSAEIDLNLFVDLFNADTAEYLGSLESSNPQTGSENPAEDVGFCNVFDFPVFGFFYVTNDAAEIPGLLMLELQAATNGNSAVLQYTDRRGSIFGHPGVESAIAVGAIDASDPGLDTLQSYSSQGPVEIQFPQYSYRAKPDITAVDGVSVTGAGGFPQTFYGTSAAAPHVAGIAALLFEAMPNANSAVIRSALKDGVVDLYGAGPDLLFGEGLISALGSEGQLDSDSDASVNQLDPDDDNDGREDGLDLAKFDQFQCSDTDRDGCDDCINGLYNPNDDGEDNDANGMCDSGDADLDTVFNLVDNCPRSANPDQLDGDSNGTGDVCEFALCAPIRVSSTKFHFVCP